MSDAPEYEWPDWLPDPDANDLADLPEPDTVIGVELLLWLVAADGMDSRPVMRVEYDAALLRRADVVRILREYAADLEAR